MKNLKDVVVVLNSGTKGIHAKVFMNKNVLNIFIPVVKLKDALKFIADQVFHEKETVVAGDERRHS